MVKKHKSKAAQEKQAEQVSFNITVITVMRIRIQKKTVMRIWIILKGTAADPERFRKVELHIRIILKTSVMNPDHFQRNSAANPDNFIKAVLRIRMILEKQYYGSR